MTLWPSDSESLIRPRSKRSRVPSMMLWSILLTSGKPMSINNPNRIRVKNAALNNTITDFGRTTIRLDYKVLLNVKDGTKVTNKMTLLCSLIPGKIEHALLDLEISPGEQCTFSIIGNNDIYLTGVIETNITATEKPSILSLKDSNIPLVLNSPSEPSSSQRPRALGYEDKQIGSVGRPVETNDKVSILFIGRVQNIMGRIFGKTESQPYTFIVGSPNSMPGLSNSVIGMRVGGERRIFISAAEGFGEKGASGVPPNTDLVIDVKLEQIEITNHNFDHGGPDSSFSEESFGSQVGQVEDDEET